MAFHPLGTARADADPSRGVVDGDLRLHGVEGLYVCDASAVPSSLGVNPQITIMALATRLAFGLLGQAAALGRAGAGVDRAAADRRRPRGRYLRALAISASNQRSGTRLAIAQRSFASRPSR